MTRHVHVASTGPSPGPIVHRSRELQSLFLFSRTPRPDAAPLRIVDDPLGPPFEAHRERGVTVSTWQSEGICLYASIDRDTYFTLCALLGLIQWRTLLLNPLLTPDDLTHADPPRCLFARQQCREDYALLFESLIICPGCQQFYAWLGVQPEILMLEEVCNRLAPKAAFSHLGVSI